jgi:hypothetical protein
MKRAWLFLILISMVTAPALGLAGTLSADNQAEKVDEHELARNAGQGCQLQTNLPGREGRIVIWDEWARNASATAGGTNSSNLGVGSVNYGQRQATFTATR